MCIAILDTFYDENCTYTISGVNPGGWESCRPWEHAQGSEYVLTPKNVTFFHRKLLLDNCKFHILKDETTFRCPSSFSLLVDWWLSTTRRCTWPRNHLVPCVAELVGSCIPVHACQGLPNPKCLFDPSGDHFCTVPVNYVVLFHSMISDGRLVGNTTVPCSVGSGLCACCEGTHFFSVLLHPQA